MCRTAALTSAGRLPTNTVRASRSSWLWPASLAGAAAGASEAEGEGSAVVALVRWVVVALRFRRGALASVGFSAAGVEEAGP